MRIATIDKMWTNHCAKPLYIPFIFITTHEQVNYKFPILWMSD